MKKLLGAALAAVVLVCAGSAFGQTRNTATSRLRMARAYCTTGPCDPFYTFAGGSTLIRRAKQPKLVTNRKFGKLRINSLQALGPPPLPATLDAQVSGTIFYGPDLNAVCPLANTVVTGPFATSTMNCVVGAAGDATCSGNLFFINFTPPACSDVSQNIQNIDVGIYEGGFVGVPTRRIATFGMNILGRTPDCASGGAGCP
jgi:hypothetical protein